VFLVPPEVTRAAKPNDVERIAIVEMVHLNEGGTAIGARLSLEISASQISS
jgi:hypothetical protein